MTKALEWTKTHRLQGHSGRNQKEQPGTFTSPVDVFMMGFTLIVLRIPAEEGKPWARLSSTPT